MPGIGQTISHYKLVEKIGQGGMGEVFLAEDTKQKRQVALKIFNRVFPDDPNWVDRFEEAINAIASLDHPNIAAIYEAGECEGSYFLALEWINGKTLAEQLQSSPIPVKEALKCAIQLAEALEAAHEKGLFHLHIKPTNVIITSECSVKIIDFGLAGSCAKSPNSLGGTTSSGNIPLDPKVYLAETTAYTSPEEARGLPADRRSDIFAFGCLLFEMIAGHQAFSGNKADEILNAIINESPDYSRLPDNIHPRLRGLISRCLEKDIEKRWQAAADVRVELENIMADPNGMLVNMTVSREAPGNAFDNSKTEIGLQIGPVEIQLRADPLEKIISATNLDAVVSSDDSMLSMSGGVSSAIAKLAGTSIRKQIIARLPLSIGSLAITTGGNLPIKHIIHAVTIDWRKHILPTERTIRQLMREILSRCEALRITRIAVPALGTGAAGLDATVSARIIAQSLHEHSLNPTVLRRVVLPIPEPYVNRAFARELARPLLEEITGADFIVGSSHSTLDETQTIANSNRLLTSKRGSLFSRARDLLSGKRKYRSTDETPGGDIKRRSLEKTKSISDLPLSATVNIHDEISLQAGSTSSRPLLNSRYVLLEEIGRGGMAIVYLSWDLILRRSVAIKVLRPDGADPESLRREAAAAIELTHEAILRIYHFEPGGEGKVAYMVMEYLPWPSGEKWIADAGAIGLPVHSVAQVGSSICNALAHAHSRNVLHLDIKPSNIFVDPSGENAKLGDFGLARLTSIDGTVLQFRPAGTPAYMAPEQKAYGPKVSPATDVYQLGATLWDFCTGTPPKVQELDIKGFEPEQRKLLSVLREVLVPDPFKRPTAIQLREMIILGC